MLNLTAYRKNIIKNIHINDMMINDFEDYYKNYALKHGNFKTLEVILSLIRALGDSKNSIAEYNPLRNKIFDLIQKHSQRYISEVSLSLMKYLLSRFKHVEFKKSITRSNGSLFPIEIEKFGYDRSMIEVNPIWREYYARCIIMFKSIDMSCIASIKEIVHREQVLSIQNILKREYTCGRTKIDRVQYIKLYEMLIFKKTCDLPLYSVLED